LRPAVPGRSPRAAIALHRHVVKLDAIPAVKLRELLWRRNEPEASTRRASDTNDTKSMAGDIGAIPKRRMKAMAGSRK